MRWRGTPEGFGWPYVPRIQGGAASRGELCLGVVDGGMMVGRMTGVGMRRGMVRPDLSVGCISGEGLRRVRHAEEWRCNSVLGTGIDPLDGGRRDGPWCMAQGADRRLADAARGKLTGRRRGARRISPGERR
ncbi:vegetative cell wall protein gp1 [Iris pallida]|uniref:Vegetative cell wall protein gp1 n=1 Tax=Iris pallida TaxID=29817 RepID=A0AAX6G7X1_IRIPA|nr:vegetative cell wall protein gp1 [Iris pallida]